MFVQDKYMAKADTMMIDLYMQKKNEDGFLHFTIDNESSLGQKY